MHGKVVDLISLLLSLFTIVVLVFFVIPFKTFLVGRRRGGGVRTMYYSSPTLSLSSVLNSTMGPFSIDDGSLETSSRSCYVFLLIIVKPSNHLVYLIHTFFG